jgi:hypothetical protein
MIGKHAVVVTNKFAFIHANDPASFGSLGRR